MCLLCGTPDPSHDLVLLRVAVLASGAGVILTPRAWLRNLTRTLVAAATREAEQPQQRQEQVEDVQVDAHG